MEKSTKAIVKWLVQSDLKMNQNKTEICLFRKKTVTPVSVIIGNTEVISGESMNMLGITSDSRLSWS
jgi:hypothetical protein